MQIKDARKALKLALQVRILQSKIHKLIVPCNGDEEMIAVNTGAGRLNAECIRHLCDVIPNGRYTALSDSERAAIYGAMGANDQYVMDCPRCNVPLIRNPDGIGVYGKMAAAGDKGAE